MSLLVLMLMLIRMLMRRPMLNYHVEVDAEVCVDVDCDAAGNVELGWRGWRLTLFRRGGHKNVTTAKVAGPNHNRL